jgi:hypothetical protein
MRRMSLLVAISIAAVLVPAGQALAAPVRADFNGDGFEDLAVGADQEDIGSTQTAGAVNVIYGSGDGLTAAGNRFFHQGNLSGSPAEESDQFGSALAAGDFDGDGFADLAVGAPFEDIGAINAAGAVNVIYGSGGGLTTSGNQFFQQGNLSGSPAEDGDNFGYALAAGDFNGDGRDDLTAGARGEDIGSIDRAGAANVIYGSAAGLTTTGNRLFHQGNLSGSPAEDQDNFGRALAAGDFDGDGQDDLAVGAAFEDIGSINSAGGVNAIYGSGGGLTTSGNRFFSQNDLSGSPAEADDVFGFALAAGDFNGDGRDDLAVGAALEDIGSIEQAGAANVIYGSGGGLTTSGNQLFHQGLLSGSPAEEFDQFGFALDTGDFNGDGLSDLGVGAPREDIGETNAAGLVNAIHGAGGGLTTSGNQLFHQGILLGEASLEQGDHFGGFRLNTD